MKTKDLAVRDKHRSADMQMIQKFHSRIAPIAKAGYAEHGRGAVSYRQKEDDAIFVPLHVIQQAPDSEVGETIRMVRQYDPASEFVITIIHKDVSLSSYRIRSI